MSMPRIDENTWFLDDCPMEVLTKAERQDRFDREIGPDVDKLKEEDLQILRKAYMLDE